MNDNCDFEAGVEAKFFIVDGVGYKLYKKKKAFEFAYRTQQLAHDHGLGPAVLGKFSVKGIGWGFITQIADLDIQEYWDDEGQERWQLERELADIGIYHDDCHDGNIGTIDGELVCIDFGPVSQECY